MFIKFNINLNNKDIIKGRWVLNKKFINNNKEPIYKARFVAKGFQQKYEINYKETFANTSKLNIIRLLIAIFINLN